MTKKERYDLYQKAFQRNGQEIQALVAAEEMGELTQAISKTQRARAEGKRVTAEMLDNLAGELADVQIVCEQWTQRFGLRQAVWEKKKEKLERLSRSVVG